MEEPIFLKPLLIPGSVQWQDTVSAIEQYTHPRSHGIRWDLAAEECEHPNGCVCKAWRKSDMDDSWDSTEGAQWCHLAPPAWARPVLLQAGVLPALERTHVSCMAAVTACAALPAGWEVCSLNPFPIPESCVPKLRQRALLYLRKTRSGWSIALACPGHVALLQSITSECTFTCKCELCSGEVCKYYGEALRVTFPSLTCRVPLSEVQACGLLVLLLCSPRGRLARHSPCTQLLQSAVAGCVKCERYQPLLSNMQSATRVSRARSQGPQQGPHYTYLSELTTGLGNWNFPLRILLRGRGGLSAIQTTEYPTVRVVLPVLQQLRLCNALSDQGLVTCVGNSLPVTPQHHLLKGREMLNEEPP
ncbi:hypothetical protein Anapl_08569 [Anas platyrhynchos]|uniref:Uncharacterized protein n=1 Tax=Anas platyrhynchos TaxID=8839 RepID=R0M8T4_ANAPL|nr:hypothetical protein Anapl_08569 [Anas platyrhynchos]